MKNTTQTSTSCVPAGRSPMTSIAKSVSFNTTVKLRRTLHISDYSAEELQAVFYSLDDYLHFKEDRKYTAQLMDFGLKFSSDNMEFCERGVEGLTRQGLRMRLANRKKTLSAVSVQQDRMWSKRKQLPPSYKQDGWIMIAAAYSKAVGPSVASAYAAGLRDEKFIQSETVMSTTSSGGTKTEEEEVGERKMRIPYPSCLMMSSSKAMVAGIAA